MSHRLGVFKQNKVEVANWVRENPNASFEVGMN